MSSCYLPITLQQLPPLQFSVQWSIMVVMRCRVGDLVVLSYCTISGMSLLTDLLDSTWLVNLTQHSCLLHFTGDTYSGSALRGVSVCLCMCVCVCLCMCVCCLCVCVYVRMRGCRSSSSSSSNNSSMCGV